MAARGSRAQTPANALALTSPIEAVPGVGPRRGAAFRRHGIVSVGHLLYHIPHRHEYEEAEAPIGSLVPGRIVSARGEVEATRVVRQSRRPRFEAVLADHTGRLDLVWFNQTYLQERIHPGARLRVQGKAQRRHATLQLVNPKFELITNEREPARAGARFRPVYPASEDLPSSVIESAVAGILDEVLPLVEDHLPEEFRRERELPSLAQAYRIMHRPRNEDELRAARRRLTYDELFLLQLGVHLKRAYVQARLHAPVLRWSPAIDRHIRARLPFSLTPAQNRVVSEIVEDLRKPIPANRLIQGDVGSGKTVVALYAMLMAVATKHQAALMAPTELLAEQHFSSVSRLLAGSNVRFELLTGSVPEAERSSLRSRLSAGEVDLIVGTHALLSESVAFQSLGVAVIDEQHRFGVHQRATLREKAGDASSSPHMLVMTATPIPRTLSLTVFGDLDVSTIDELPPGRGQVKTRWFVPDRSEEAYAQARRRIEAGGQAYVVVPAIDGDSDGGGSLRDVRSTVQRLEAGPFSGLRIAAIHGRLKRETREQIMGRFRSGLIDVLVATTVIEVGVDVPNASVMVIEQADRFGLAQLHQLRGRIGRGERESLCILIAGPQTPEAHARMEAIVKLSDGFALAERDFELRGPGELFGSRQSGLPPFRLASFPADLDLLNLARRDAAAWVKRSPMLDRPEERLLKSRLLKAFGHALALGDVA